MKVCTTPGADTLSRVSLVATGLGGALENNPSAPPVPNPSAPSAPPASEADNPSAPEVNKTSASSAPKPDPNGASQEEKPAVPSQEKPAPPPENNPTTSSPSKDSTSSTSASTIEPKAKASVSVQTAPGVFGRLYKRFACGFNWFRNLLARSWLVRSLRALFKRPAPLATTQSAGKLEDKSGQDGGSSSQTTATSASSTQTVADNLATTVETAKSCAVEKAQSLIPGPGETVAASSKPLTNNDLKNDAASPPAVNKGAAPPLAVNKGAAPPLAVNNGTALSPA